jgi:hypothetical protein
MTYTLVFFALRKEPSMLVPMSVLSSFGPTIMAALLPSRPYTLAFIMDLLIFRDEPSKLVSMYLLSSL